jgi:hypothetical protein
MAAGDTVAANNATAGSGTFTIQPAANAVYTWEEVIDVDNSATAIVVKTTFSGTSIAYKISATVEQMI